MKNKRNLILILIGAVVLILAVVLFVIFGWGKKPLKDLKAQDVVSIQIQTAPPYEETVINNEGEIKQFVDEMQKIVVYEERTVDNKAAKQVVFTLTMKDGTTKRISAYEPYVKIDNVAYRAKGNPCEALSKLGKDFLSLEEKK